MSQNHNTYPIRKWILLKIEHLISLFRFHSHREWNYYYSKVIHGLMFNVIGLNSKMSTKIYEVITYFLMRCDCILLFYYYIIFITNNFEMVTTNDLTKYCSICYRPVYEYCIFGLVTIEFAFLILIFIISFWVRMHCFVFKPVSKDVRA